MGPSFADRIGFPCMGKKNKCGLGHYLAMAGLLDEYSRRPFDAALVIEDDVVFSRGWFEYAIGAIKEAAEAGDAWIACLYRFVDDTADAWRAGRRLEMIRNRFYGTQANIYSARALAGLPGHVLRNVVLDLVDPIDGAVERYARERGIPTYAVVPSVVEHIGERSTGQTEGTHRAAIFFPEVPERDASNAGRSPAT